MDEEREIEPLVRLAAAGDKAALDRLLGRYRERLLRMVRVRMDRRLQGRVDASDVVQEAALEAMERLESYAREPDMPFLVWIRFLTAQKIVQFHRRHLGVKARDAAREVPLDRPRWPRATSAVLAEGLAARQTSPSQAAAKHEMRDRLRAALDGMDPMDREILSLRHFEQLSNAEAAAELGLEEAAASKRYIRAIGRLSGLLGGRLKP